MSPQPRTPASARSTAVIQGVLRHIGENLNQPLTLSELAGLTGLSMWRFATVFREQVGVAPHRYICRLRLEHAQLLIREGVPAATAASEAGFYDQSHFLGTSRACWHDAGQYLMAAARGPHPHARDARRTGDRGPGSRPRGVEAGPACHPELAFKEHRMPASSLGTARPGLEVHEGIGGTGVVGILRAGRGGRSVGLRATWTRFPSRKQDDAPT